MCIKQPNFCHKIRHLLPIAVATFTFKVLLLAIFTPLHKILKQCWKPTFVSWFRSFVTFALGTCTLLNLKGNKIQRVWWMLQHSRIFVKKQSSQTKQNELMHCFDFPQIAFSPFHTLIKSRQNLSFFTRHSISNSCHN